MAIAIAMGLLATAVQTAGAVIENPENCTRWHTVKQGEYLALIADLYDTSWRSIAEINRMSNPSLIFPNQKLCVFSKDYTPGSPVVVPTTKPGATVYASSVREDQYVTLQGKDLSANTRYAVYLGKYNAGSSGKILVGSVVTDKFGSFKKTFDLPKKLFDVMKISVSISSSSGATSSNWFINATSSGYTGGTNSAQFKVSVQSVKRNQWVKLSTVNLPPNVTFKVYLNKAGATERKAVQVGTLRDTKGGSILATFDIPESLKDRAQLEVVVFNNPIGVSSEATFYNQTSK
jgi:hypothetical protein